jgi:hypothetical protein
MAVVAVLLATVVAPTHSGAVDAVSGFPPVGNDTWEGLVFFSGSLSSDSEAADGSFSTSITDVINDTAISVDFVVGSDGRVTSGTMDVDLTWFKETVGTTPVNLDPFRVVHDHHQTGRLQITGSAERLVVSGTLTHTSNTMADGDTVEEVSGTESRDVEWVFSAVENTCAKVTAELVEASGISLINSALIPRVNVSDSQEIHSDLVLGMLVWPASVDDPDAVNAAIEKVVDLANLIHDRDFPSAANLLELVDAWNDLNTMLARLEVCQTPLGDWGPVSTRSWLVGVLQRAVDKALENQETYDAQELIDLWDAAMHEQALDGDLVVRLLDAFHDKLDEAIADGDTATITDILAFAAAYGYPNLHAKAKAAL